MQLLALTLLLIKKNVSELEPAYLYKGIVLLDLNDLAHALWHFERISERNKLIISRANPIPCKINC